jgi:uncharacterized protein YgbK (DUF1537 family)
MKACQWLKQTCWNGWIDRLMQFIKEMSEMQPNSKVADAAPLMGVIADDSTGANDIGIMFALSNYRTCVYPASQGKNLPIHPAAPVCILNTNSRLDSPELSYQKVYQAALDLRSIGCTRFYKKTCSVFRGNIGAEFDALLDATGMEFAVIVLGYPKNGRMTINGIHYVHGQQLSQSEFAQDPIHPMTRSSLVEILQSQTQRVVALVPGSITDQGADALRQYMTVSKRSCSYLIFDVRSQADLMIIAEVVKDEPVICGSSALAEFLPRSWTVHRQGTPAPVVSDTAGLGVLVISGSQMPQTAAQIEYLHRSGAVVLEMDGTLLWEDADLMHTTEQWIRTISAAMCSGQNVILHAGYRNESVQRTLAAGHRAGLSKIQIARHITSALADIGIQSLQAAGQNRLIAAGGETSDAVCDRLGIQGLQIWQEIEPGLPSCITLSDPPYLLALKSGSFGTPSFLSSAIHHLNNAALNTL